MGRDGHKKRLQEVEEQLRAVAAIGSAMATCVGLDDLFVKIVPNISRFMAAERTTLFIYDEGRQEIWSKVAQGEEAREIRLKLGEGIAGWVAQNRQPVRINDPYGDPRFNPDIDKRTGFVTRSLVTLPLVDKRDRLLGVIQVLNKPGGFAEQDLVMLRAISVETAYAVENAALAQELLDRNVALAEARARAEARSAELDLLYRLEQQISGAVAIDEVLDPTLAAACERLRSDAGSVLLLHDDAGRLFFHSVKGLREAELKHAILEPGEGVVGWVAQHRQPVILNDPSGDPRHHVKLAGDLDYPVEALLAVPIVWDDKVIGALEVLNPKPHPGSRGRGYGQDDLKVLTLIASQLASALARAQERRARIDMERLAVIGRMLASVAHDLRNPMAVISGFAQLMAGEVDAAERDRCCERILHQVDEMAAMVGDLLAFSRGDSQLKPVVVDLDAFAQEIRDCLTMRCGPRGIELFVESAGGSAKIDVGRTKRIVYNLAQNAVDVLRRGGALRMSVDAHRGGVAIRVQDDGPGLSESIRARIFDPFVTEGKVNGTGLGLAIVKRFVDDHAGTIEVRSQLGKGTRFDVHLPRAGG